MNSRLNYVALVMLCILAAAQASRYFHSAAEAAPTEKLAITGKDGNRHAFDVEIARTPTELEVGLMFRKTMPPDHGMLFELGAQPVVTHFWMKNTLIPLDMLFIAADGTVKTIHENAAPQSLAAISSEVPVIAVLELNGGRARALGIAPGSHVQYSYFHASDAP